jgi:Glycosyltransferase family 87
LTTINYKNIGSILVLLLPLASLTSSILAILRSPETLQWDLTVYYQAPITYEHGSNPYQVNHFPYPPLYLPLFTLVPALFSYQQFHRLFLLAKIISLALLLFLWKRFFLRHTRLDVFAVVVWLGFYGTFFGDLQAGNISVFETTLLFVAFLSFLTQRLLSFVLLILITASFKVTPIVFLVLLPLSLTENRWTYFAFGCTGFIGFGLLNLILFPDFTTRFVLDALERTSESGVICPSSLAFFRDALRQVLAHLRMDSDPIVATPLYLAFASVILCTSWKAWRTSRLRDARTFLILFVIVVYALTMPRMKDYAYMLVIPSALFAIEQFAVPVPRWWMVMPLILIPATTASPPLSHLPYVLLWDYWPLFIVFCLWSLYLRELKGVTTSPSLASTNR